MALFGQLSTMSLMDLLQWAGLNRKTGVFELERDKVTKKLFFREGRVVACYSDDPNSRLGQLLLSRGKITSDQLRDALGVQQATGDSIGSILRQQGLISNEELTEMLSAKADEIVLSLFDWQEAIFRFQETGTLGPYVIDLDLSVDDILLKGLQRVDELGIIRQVFPSSGVVLGLTGKALPPEIGKSAMAQRIIDSVDGQRTLAGILLHTNASDFLVLKFLYNLYNRGVVQIEDVREAHEEMVTIVDPWRSEDDFAVPEPSRGTAHWGAVPEHLQGQSDAEAPPADAFCAEMTADAPTEEALEFVEEEAIHSTVPTAGDELAFDLDAEVESPSEGSPVSDELIASADELGSGVVYEQEANELDLGDEIDAAYGFGDLTEPTPPSAPAESSSDVEPGESLADLELSESEASVDDAAHEAVRALALEMEETLTIVPWSEKRRRVEVDEETQQAKHLVDINAGLETARAFLSRNDAGKALDVLDKCYRDHPNDPHVKSLMEEAEKAYTDAVTTSHLPLDGVPAVIADEAERISCELPPQSAYLLSMVDGVTEIRSMFWLAPMREVEVLRILDRLTTMGVVKIESEVPS